MLRFAGIEPDDDRIPDGPKGPWPRWGRASPKDAILNFRHLLRRHGLTQAIFADVNAHLADKGITLRSGTLVDATIIDVPSSTRDKEKARDPEMSSTRKGNDWYFGSEADQKSIRWIDFPTNAHVGVNSHTDLVHSLQTTTARAHDSQVRDELLHGKATSVWAELPLERRRQRCSDRWRSRWQFRATIATST